MIGYDGHVEVKGNKRTTKSSRLGSYVGPENFELQGRVPCKVTYSHQQVQVS